MFADDAVVIAAGSNLITGEYRGRDALVQLGAREGELTSGRMRYELTEVAASDDYVFIIFHLDYERDGRKLDTHV